MTPETLRVVVADDSALVRAAISYLLSSISDVELVATCDDLESLTDAMAFRPALVVIGAGFARSADGDGDGDGDGAAIAHRLLDAWAGLGVLEIGHEAKLRAAVNGADRHLYLRKDQLLDRDEFAAALRGVTRSRHIIRPINAQAP